MRTNNAELINSFLDPVDFGHETAGQKAVQAAQLRCVPITPHPLASRQLGPAVWTDVQTQSRSHYFPTARSLLRYPGYGDESATRRRWHYIAGCVTEHEPSINDMKLFLKAHQDRAPEGSDIKGLRIITSDKDVCFELIGHCGSYFLSGCRTDRGKRREANETLKMLFDFLSGRYGITLEQAELDANDGPKFFKTLKDTWDSAYRIRNSPEGSPLRRPWEQSRKADRRF